MKILIPISFLILANCSGYTVASMSTNVISIASTGKTNTDHVISLLTQKDCRIFRAIRKEQLCVLND